MKNLIENICLMLLIGFLCWIFDSGWPCLLFLFGNFYGRVDAQIPKDMNNKEV